MIDTGFLSLAAVATCIVAPLAGSLALRFAGRRFDPRVLAAIAMGISLAAAVVAAACWHLGDGRPATFGHRLVGGHVILVDGLTSLMLPYVALVDMAIVLVTPRRAFASPGVRRLLMGAAITFATLATSHPYVLVILWAASILSTWTTIRSTVGGRGAARVYGLAMSAALACMVVGTACSLPIRHGWLAAARGASPAAGWSRWP